MGQIRPPQLFGVPARHRMPSSALGLVRAPRGALASRRAGRCSQASREEAPPPRGGTQRTQIFAQTPPPSDWFTRKCDLHGGQSHCSFLRAKYFVDHTYVYNFFVYLILLYSFFQSAPRRRRNIPYRTSPVSLAMRFALLIAFCGASAQVATSSKVVNHDEVNLETQLDLSTPGVSYTSLSTAQVSTCLRFVSVPFAEVVGDAVP